MKKNTSPLAVPLLLGLLAGLSWNTATGAASGGTIEGTIKVWRTKVTTDGPKSGKEVVVYLEKVGDNTFPAPTKHARLDQKGLVFIPHVVAILKGTTVEFLNSDHDRHNVYLLFEKSGKELDLGTWKPGDVRSRKFDEVDAAVALCKLHLEMEAYVVVLPNPFFTVAAIDDATQQARYAIKDVPPGKYTLLAWHKKLKVKGGSVAVTVEGGKSATVDFTITKKKYAK